MRKRNYICPEDNAFVPIQKYISQISGEVMKATNLIAIVQHRLTLAVTGLDEFT